MADGQFLAAEQHLAGRGVPVDLDGVSGHPDTGGREGVRDVVGRRGALTEVGQDGQLGRARATFGDECAVGQDVVDEMNELYQQGAN